MTEQAPQMNNEAMTQATTEVAAIIPKPAELGQLKAMNTEFSLTMKYKTADDWASIKDTELRCFFMGMKDIPNENGELVKCGVFVTESECFIAGPMTLVEAVKNLPPKTALSITYLGKKKNATTDGSTMLFEVKTLA